jgi:hypothetical protein
MKNDGMPVKKTRQAVRPSVNGRWLNRLVSISGLAARRVRPRS